jgi:hypothetical protein
VALEPQDPIKKPRRQNYVNGCNAVELAAPPPPAQPQIQNLNLNISQSRSNDRDGPLLPPPISLADEMINSDSCNSNSQNIVNSKQHKHKKHKKSKDMKKVGGNFLITFLNLILFSNKLLAKSQSAPNNRGISNAANKKSGTVSDQ